MHLNMMNKTQKVFDVCTKRNILFST